MHSPTRIAARIVDWLSEELNKASLVRRNSKEHSSFRRLTNYEYNYALQDLLGLPYALANKLPPETASEDGFKNSSELLQMSAMQFETYREIGLKALKRATVSGERPQAVTYIISMQEEMDKAAAKEMPRRSTQSEASSSKSKKSAASVESRDRREHSVLRWKVDASGRGGCRANACRFSRCAGASPIQRVETGSGSLSSRRRHHACSHSSRTLDDEPRRVRQPASDFQCPHQQQRQLLAGHQSSATSR